MIDMAKASVTPPNWTQAFARFGGAGRAVADHDWAQTRLGPLETWPSALVALAQSTLASPWAAALAVGPQGALIGNAAMARLLGCEARDLAGAAAAEIFAAVWPPAAEAFERAYAGEIVSAESQHFRRSGGETAIVDVTLAALSGLDVPCVQAQARESRAQVCCAHTPYERGDLDDLPLVAWRATTDGEWLWASPRWTLHTGLSAEEICGFDWLRAVHPEDRARTQELWLQAQHDGAFRCDHRLYDKRRAAYAWRRTRASAISAGDGEAVEWVAASTDVDDLATPQTAALSEARRRQRNTLGIIRSIARRTAETTDSVDGYAMHLEGRLDAIARVGGLIGGAPPGAPLDALVAEELMSLKTRENAKVEIAGPPLRIRPEAAELIGLAIHELAINAMKFGALSPAGGRLDVSWRLTAEDPDRLLLSWKESGVEVGPSTQRANGFGLDLLRRGLAYALDSRTDFDLREDGVVCEIKVLATRAVA